MKFMNYINLLYTAAFCKSLCDKVDNTKPINHPAAMGDQIFSGAFQEITPYFMNRDGCMETTATVAQESAFSTGAGTGMTGLPHGIPPPPLGMGVTSNSNGNDGYKYSRSGILLF